jgi:6-pyruvoyl-tetrahydropterin synthase
MADLEHFSYNVKRIMQNLYSSFDHSILLHKNKSDANRFGILKIKAIVFHGNFEITKLFLV